MPVSQRYAKLIVKDSLGELVQLLPEVKTSSVIDAQSNLPVDSAAVQSALSGVDDAIASSASALRAEYQEADDTLSAAIVAVQNNLDAFEASAGMKEVAVLLEAPSTENTAALQNSSIVFASESGGSNAASPTMLPVYTAGRQTITGVKVFAAGVYGGVTQMASGTNAIDVQQGSCFVKTVAAATTFSFVNVPTDAACCVTLVLKNGGNYSVTWPSSVKWTSNTVPDLTRNGTDVLTFITCDGGTVWYGTATCVGVTA